VGRVPTRTDRREELSVGKPQPLIRGSMRSKIATCGGSAFSGYGGAGGVGGIGVSGGGSGVGSAGSSTLGSGGNFYSPELSTDFLELPQSLDEQRNYFPFFYRADPFVGQAIDLHTELPLSKIRLGGPEAKSKELGDQSLDFIKRWCKNIGLLHRLIEIVHEYNLLGEVFIFFEDRNPEMPEDIRVERKYVLPDEEGAELIEQAEERDNADERAADWMQANYEGWTAIRVLPPEQIHLEGFPFTDEKLIELIPDSKTKAIIEMAGNGDERAKEIVESMPADVVSAVTDGKNIPLNTNPKAGSFCYYMANKRSQYEPRGHSRLERCIRTLVYKDKCLLPGCLVWVRRKGIPQQVRVETIQDGEFLLTHKGRFRKAITGSREIEEDIVALAVEGIRRPLCVTRDHRVLVVEDGVERWIEAGELRPGQQLCEPSIDNGDRRRTFDLRKWWGNRHFAVQRRSLCGGETCIVDRHLSVCEVSEEDNTLYVTFSFPQDHVNRVGAVQGMRKLLEWLRDLERPTQVSYKALSEVTGISPVRLRNYAFTLRKRLGLRMDTTPVGAGPRKTTWHPAPPDAEVPDETQYHTLASGLCEVPLTEDVCYLLGAFLGDGAIWHSDCRFLNTCYVEWSFGGDAISLKVRDRIARIAGDLISDENLHFTPVMGEYDTESAIHYVRVEDELFARWVAEEMGVDCYTKRLPFWVFELADEQIKALLCGLLDTDGSLKVGLPSNDKTVEISVELANATLIDQLHLLCNRVGLVSYVGQCTRSATSITRRWKTKSGMREKTYTYPEATYYSLRSTDYSSVREWSRGSVKGEETEWVERKYTWRSRFDHNRLTRRITGVERIPYTGTVYSFDVEEDESHTGGGLLLHNCRQAQTSIASRHMTPIRLVYAENMNQAQTEALRDQIDLALQDPDYSIVTNFQVTWEEMTPQGRLLELSGEYELINRELYAGLGVTESLLSGESSYSGDRINLEVINVRYMLMREIVQDLIEEYCFKPMCARMGFIETVNGRDQVVYPKLSFTRLALRDNQDTYDALYNLYSKGSIPVSTILDLLNIDPESAAEELERDFATFQDATFNEVLRGAYSSVGTKLADDTDFTEMIAKRLGLKYEPKEEGGGGRF